VKDVVSHDSSGRVPSQQWETVFDPDFKESTEEGLLRQGRLC